MDQVRFAQQVKPSGWLVSYYVAIVILSYLGHFDRIELLKSPWDQALFAVIIHYWGGRSGLPRPIVDDDEVEDEVEAEVATAR